MRFGITEILVILAVVLLLFGAKKLPDIARSLGKSVKELKKGLDEGGDEGINEDK
jgi:sec-independent protein translocase protein TatA